MPYWNGRSLIKYTASKPVKQSLAIVMGTIFQWFDFALFSAVSTKLASSFYPSTLPHTLSMLMVWLSFAVGWLLAPIGGAVFGYIGDTYSRKIALTLSITLMSGASLLIALLPTYQAIGIWAPILLLIARLLQGLSSSAEYNGATIYLVENAPDRLKPFAGCLPNISNSAGMMLGFLAGAIFTKSNMPDWAWRIPFLLAFIGLICAYQLRGKVLESDVNFIHLLKHKTISYSGILKKASFMVVLAAYNGVTSWGIYVWLPVLLTYFGLSSSQASLVILIGLALDIVLEAMTGLFAQKIDNKKIFLLFSTLFVIGLYPTLKLFQLGSFYLDIIGMIFITLLISPATAMINSIAVQSVEKKVRYLTLGIFWNIGMTLFGGTAPAVFSFFMHYADQASLLIMLYMSIFVLLGFIMVKRYARR
ncbi:MAG: MFS transporter [Legionellales bacterium]|nr:MFS transporter [Legionellales bacterium]